ALPISASALTVVEMQSRMCLRTRNCTVEFSTVKISCDSSVHYIPKEIFIIFEIEALLSGLDNSTVAEFESVRPPHREVARQRRIDPDVHLQGGCECQRPPLLDDWSSDTSPPAEAVLRWPWPSRSPAPSTSNWSSPSSGRSPRRFWPGVRCRRTVRASWPSRSTNGSRRLWLWCPTTLPPGESSTLRPMRPRD